MKDLVLENKLPNYAGPEDKQGPGVGLCEELCLALG